MHEANFSLIYLNLFSLCFPQPFVTFDHFIRNFHGSSSHIVFRYVRVPSQTESRRGQTQTDPAQIKNCFDFGIKTFRLGFSSILPVSNLVHILN